MPRFDLPSLGLATQSHLALSRNCTACRARHAILLPLNIRRFRFQLPDCNRQTRVVQPLHALTCTLSPSSLDAPRVRELLQGLPPPSSILPPPPSSKQRVAAPSLHPQVREYMQGLGLWQPPADAAAAAAAANGAHQVAGFRALDCESVKAYVAQRPALQVRGLPSKLQFHLQLQALLGHDGFILQGMVAVGCWVCAI